MSTPSHHGSAQLIRHAVACLVLLALTVTVFGSTVRFDFTNYDEVAQLIENPLVHQLTPCTLWGMFTQRVITSYYPLRVLSFAVDHVGWGMNPTGYHLTNVVLHAVNVLLVFALWLRLGSTEGEGRLGGAVLAAAVFAVHPVVVEPVAWVAGREELLMTFFVLASLHLYVIGYGPGTWSAGRRVVARGLVIGAALLAGLSNAAAVVLPALIAGYALQRSDRARLGVLAGRMAPYVMIAAGVAGLKLAETTPAGVPTDVAQVPSLDGHQRILTALAALGRNVESIVWPTVLVPSYPFEVPMGVMDARVGAGVIAVLALGGLGWALRRDRLGVWALSWFLVAMLPTAQLWAHPVFRADRYLYLPVIGLAFALARWVVRGAARLGQQRLLMVTAAVYVLLLAVQSSQQVWVWQNSRSVFAHTVAHYPHHADALINLGTALADEGNVDRASDVLMRAAQVARGPVVRARALTALGMVRLRAGRPDEAVVSLRQALALEPPTSVAAKTRLELGLALARLGRDVSARECLKRVTQDVVSSRVRAQARATLATIAMRAEAFDDALDLLNEAAKEADLPEVFANRGTVHARMGRFGLAVNDFTRALDLRPGHALYLFNRGQARQAMGDVQQARQDWQDAVEADPEGAIGGRARGLLQRTAHDRAPSSQRSVR